MRTTIQILKASLVMSLLAATTACIVAGPREGYYDADHHRYYREHAWHECVERDVYCR